MKQQQQQLQGIESWGGGGPGEGSPVEDGGGRGAVAIQRGGPGRGAGGGDIQRGAKGRGRRRRLWEEWVPPAGEGTG